MSRAIWMSLMLLLTVALITNTAFAATTTVVLSVAGMTWGSWPLVVKKALEGLKGIISANVTFRTKEAAVDFDPARVTIEEMLVAVRQAGFQPSVKKAPNQ